MNTNTSIPVVTIYTDGGADPNPGPGGWGAVLIFDKEGKKATRELKGGAAETTNNRMELTAAIEALRALKTRCQVELYTDSQYLKNGITEWMPKWLATGFKKGKIQNVELWQALNTEVARHDIRWHWVKGHAGNVYNELVDRLATSAMPNSRQITPAAPHDEPSQFTAYLGTSCTGSPGAGGWAVLLSNSESAKIAEAERLLWGSHPNTNSARLDLLAAIAALEAVPNQASIAVFSPSSYLIDGITQWITGWKKNAWMKKTGGEVLYRNLWQHLDQLQQVRRVRWRMLKPGQHPPEMARLKEPLVQAVDNARHMTEPPPEP